MPSLKGICFICLTGWGCAVPAGVNKMKKFLIAAVKFYRKNISPARPPCCRFSPTCSEYALEALEKYGALKGTYLAIRRLLKCNPFHKGGYDPVP